tara:strand:+ start:2396 stop:3190 length:795 start_codon:yes stop_codon:yes gene_type:complete
MYTINITHRGDKEPTTYKVYREVEAKEKGVKYVYWKEADTGEYGLSDDKYVAKVISRREYPSNHDIPNTYLRFPWGYTFFNAKYPSKQLKVKGRKTNVTFTGKSYIEVQSRQDKMKNLATMFALKPDYDLAIEWAMGAVTDSERRKWKRTMKSEIFKNMVKDELQGLLTEHGLTENYTLELLEETIKLAKDKKDITNLMRAVDNLQDMHGMKDKNLIKTVDKLETSSSTKLLDEIVEEEQKLVATRTSFNPDTGEVGYTDNELD